MLKCLLGTAVLLVSCAAAQAQQPQLFAETEVQLSLPISEALGWDFLKRDAPAPGEKDQVFSFSIAGMPAPTGFHNFVVAN